MVKSYMNAHGVSVFINAEGILLSYALDSKEHIEVSFPSVQFALKTMEVATLSSITVLSLMSIAMADCG